MSTLKERIENRLRERIAEASAESGATKAPDTRPLFDRLDDVIRVVEQIRDYSVEPYYDKVREVICTSCRQTPEGRCATRESEMCALDQYFPLIVATIEQELKES